MNAGVAARRLGKRYGRLMPRAWRPVAAALAAAGAVGAQVALAADSGGANTRTVTTLSRAGAPLVAGGPPAIVTPASQRATLRITGPAGVAAMPTAQGFLGVATSLSTIPALAGTAADPDIPFRRLLRNLSPDAPFVLRLGGVSADTSWWAIRGIKKPPYLYTLTPRWGAEVHALLNALGGTAILGVNLEAGPQIESKVARVEVADFERYVGADRIDAFELGNEPERVVGTTIASYTTQFSRIASQLGRVPLAGPASVGPVWLRQLGTILDRLPSRLKLVTVHVYPLKSCSRRAHLSMSAFFARSSIAGLAGSVHEMVKAADAHGKPLRVDELGGVTCGGKAGLSNSFGEALWALNVLPALWRAGVQGVNFQTVDGALNQVITAKHLTSGWHVSVEPVYYGLLAFADVAPAGSRLLRVSGSVPPRVDKFAVRAPDGSERVVVTNPGSVARSIGVAAPGSHGAGSLSLLRARSLSATTGTTLAGQRLSARTGRLIGPPRVTPVEPNRRGVYAVRVPANAAAILTLTR